MGEPYHFHQESLGPDAGAPVRGPGDKATGSFNQQAETGWQEATWEVTHCHLMQKNATLQNQEAFVFECAYH